MSEYAIKYEVGEKDNFIFYTDPKRVTGVFQWTTTPPNPYVFGYGRKIPTRNFVLYRTSEKEGQKIRPRRVWVMNYANIGSAYIIVQGKEVFLDSDTEFRIEKMVEEGKSFA
jgi:hypothetical protein